MTAAVFSERDTSMAETEFNIEFRITDAVPDLIIIPSGKNSKCGTERNKTHCAHTGSHIYHVGLSDSAVIKPVGISLFKSVCHGCAGKISIQHDHFLIFFAQLDKGFTVCNANCFLFHFFSPPIPSVPGQPVQR